MNKTNNKVIQLLRYVVAIPKYNQVLKKFTTFTIHDDFETVQTLLEDGMSISRFGDGEFDWAFGRGQQNGFQSNNRRLASRLRQVLQSNDVPSLMIGVPRQLTSIKDENWLNRYFWTRAIKARGSNWASIMTRGRTYWSSTFTRPYMGRKNQKLAVKVLNCVKQIFLKRDIIVVEGELTRFGLGTDFLDGATSVKRVIAPAKNAFDLYDKLLKRVVTVADRDDNPLIIISLGPTATVLAYDLAKKGFQAIDIGHADMEYYWCINHASEPIDIPWKYMNELEGGAENRELPPDYNEYFEQIVDVVKSDSKAERNR